MWLIFKDFDQLYTENVLVCLVWAEQKTKSQSQKKTVDSLCILPVHQYTYLFFGLFMNITSIKSVK